MIIHKALLTAFLIALAGCQAPAPTPQPDVTRATPASAPRGHRSQPAATPATFDFYLLNLSWNPEYCATHSSAAECAAHRGFVVHGLWPQNNNGSFPEHCSNAPGPDNPNQYLDLQPTVSLITHEWQTHGTCSGLSPDAYFQAIRKAAQQVTIPAPYQPGHTPPAMLPPESILAQFAATNPSYPQGSFALSCGNNHLTAIEACFTTDIRPEACQSVRTCRANAVKITAP